MGALNMPAVDAAFAGSIPEIYHRHLGPTLFQPFATDLGGRVLGQQGWILELACGTGIVTQMLALATPAHIMATDLNAPMIEYARGWVDFPQIDWREADAQALPFDDGDFDLVVCQFGVMFFPDRAGAHREARRVLRKTGRYIFSVWDHLERNPAVEALHAAVSACFPADPPRFIERTPYGYSDTERIRHDALSGGFHEVEVETISQQKETTARDLAIGFCQGSPLRNEILARDPDGLNRVTEQVEAALVATFGAAPFTAPFQAHVVTAKP
jgi:ubiquinone/menaquinone biosynthesis C-methylase UbiE